MDYVIVENVPEWAVCAIEYGDNSGLDERDACVLRRWLDGLERDGLRLVCPVDGSENGFCALPAFGGACGTVDYYAERV